MMALGVSLRMAIVSDHAYITTLVVMPNIIYEKKIFLWFLFLKTQSILLCMRNQLKRIFLKWDHIMSLTPESKSPKEWTHFLSQIQTSFISNFPIRYMFIVIIENFERLVDHLRSVYFQESFLGVFSSLHRKIIFD